ncbi:CCNJ protein, partial [Polyodon spathula]|nr:cyclin-J-like [Polyodon spathula]XP_041079913.1 cyclin-J-like [Polyodon spathula]MBN3286269.1 CCNJ protein [Polyodon spathula]
MGRMEMEEQWWKGQLAADIHQALRIKELKLPAFRAHSPQIGMRRYFADLLAILSNRYQLCPTARHLAVYLLDLFMDHYDVAVKQLYVIALSCLLLASKFEEKEDRVPKLEQLNNLSFMCTLNLVLNKKDLIKMEVLLLETFNWNLCMPTAAHFIDYYLYASVQENDLHNGWPLTSITKTKAFIEKYTHYFLEVSLQDHSFLSFRPSQVAAACIAASRICLQISPSWTTQLHLLTGYTWDHLTQCIELMLMAHDNDVKEANKTKTQHPSIQPPPPPVAVQRHHQSTSTQPLLFTPASYTHLSQHSTPLSQLHSLADAQVLAPVVPRDYLQAHRATLLSGSASASNCTFHSYPSLPSSLQPPVRTLPIQGPISMQVAIATEPRHCLSVTYGSSYLSGHHSFAAGCFDR